MTDEELDQARAEEALKRFALFQWKEGTPLAALTDAARLAREGWMPPVDPLLLEAREIEAKSNETRGHHVTAADTRSGRWDSSRPVQNILAALRRGIEIGEGK